MQFDDLWDVYIYTYVAMTSFRGWTCITLIYQSSEGYVTEDGMVGNCMITW